MSFDFNNDIPIYLQIIENIKMQIINKEYNAGDKLPSVRELSVLYAVNPNTIQKALGELEEIGLIFTERTNGKFVTEDMKVINKIKAETLKGKIDAFLEDMLQMGIDSQEIIEIIKNKEQA